MADIFISYSSADKTNVKLLAELLEEHGWSVWWDREIPIGQRFDSVIEEELARAYCVIVIWTKRSIASEWVKNEASEALQSGKLVPVMLEEVQLPLAFKRTEAALLMDWNGEPDHTEFGLLLNSVDQTIKKNKAKVVTLDPDATTNYKNSKPEERTISQRTKPSVLHIAMAIAGFVVALFSIYYYVNVIKAGGHDDRRVSYLILVLFGIASAAAISGLLNSYVTLKGEKFSTRFKMAGPLAGIVLTVFGGLYLPHDPVEKTIAIRVFDKKKNPVTQGDVKIYLREYIRTQSIDKMGQALFTGIPQRDPNENIKIEITSPGYATKQFDTVLNKSATLELTLPLTAIVFISGKVTTAADNPIKDVEINVDGTRYVAYSINNGDYHLRLEEYTLGDEITITSSHRDFEDKTKAVRINSPEIKGVDFVLNPIHHQ